MAELSGFAALLDRPDLIGSSWTQSSPSWSMSKPSTDDAEKAPRLSATDTGLHAQAPRLKNPSPSICATCGHGDNVFVGLGASTTAMRPPQGRPFAQAHASFK